MVVMAKRQRQIICKRLYDPKTELIAINLETGLWMLIIASLVNLARQAAELQARN